MICTVQDCTHSAVAHGYCDTHYRRWKKHGDLTTDKRVKHGRYGTPEYVCWRAMLSRCENTKHKSFNDYGGRGIVVCARWHEFSNFYSDMGPRPSPAHSLDRYPNQAGNYEPGNCRWATPQQQNLNMKRTVFVAPDGIEIPLVELAQSLGISPRTIRARLARGWSQSRLTAPVRSKH